MLVVNPNKYSKYFENEKSKKNHNGIKKDLSVWSFKRSAGIFNLVRNVEKFRQTKIEKEENIDSA